MTLRLKTYHLLCILFLGMTFTNIIAQSNKTYVNTTLRARDWGTYPVVLSNEVKGGIHSVSDTSDITIDRRQTGMLAVIGDLNYDGNDVVMQYDATSKSWQRVNLLRVYANGKSYADGSIVLDGVKLYVAKNAVNNAATAPSADATNWFDLQSQLSTTDAHINNANIHRSINDAATGATDLWSAQRIIQYVGNADAAAAGDGLTWDAANTELDVNPGDGISVSGDSVSITHGSADQYMTMNAAGNAVEWRTINLNSSSVTLVSSAINLTDAQQGVIMCGGAADYTVGLPDVSAASDGATFKIKNIGTGEITIDGFATQTIDGDATFNLVEQYASVTIVNYSGAWYIIEKQAKNSLYVGNPGTTGSWRITFDVNGMQFQQRAADGTWSDMLEVED